MPNLGPQYDLATRLATLERLVAQLAANQIGQAFSATQSDGSVGMQVVQSTTGSGSTAMIFYQGANTTRDPNTGAHPRLLYIGELFAGGVSVDSGAIAHRPDAGNTQSLVIGNRGTQILDPLGHQVLATDEYGNSPSGEGLTSPILALASPVATGSSSWPKTNSTSLGTVAQSEFVAQHPHVWWVAQAVCDAGVNGSVQAQIVGASGAVATGPAHTVTGTTFINISDTLVLPAGFWRQTYAFEVQAQVTSGTGNIYCQTLLLNGMGTS